MADSDRLAVNLVGQTLLDGELYSQEDLQSLEETLLTNRANNLCVPLDLRNEVVIRVAQVELQISLGNADAVEQDLNATEESARHAISCDPNMSLAWIALAWAEFVRNDYTPRMAELVRMSMVTGANEGWSIARRVQLLLEALPKMTDPQMRDLLAGQVRRLMAGGYNRILAFHYVRLEDAERRFLADIFATGDKDQQTKIAAEVWRSGEDIDLPLTPARGTRPWN
ncbi:hypothetical protein [Xanthobacter sp. KR7-225]|uniref:hypothetical protein n=1 Tax=Xanthobacter sp. KR7-225 TaxID=3156613 RepID=UPI0032B5578A